MTPASRVVRARASVPPRPGGSTTAAPASSAGPMRCSPVPSTRSPGPSSTSADACSSVVARLAGEWTTPRGAPVVPEVNRTSAAASPGERAAGVATGETIEARRTADAEDARRRPAGRARASPGPGAARRAAPRSTAGRAIRASVATPPSVTTARTPAARHWAASSAGATPGSSTTTTIPARSAPSSHAMPSASWRTPKATGSPASRPACANAPAYARTRAAERPAGGDDAPAGIQDRGRGGIGGCRDPIEEVLERHQPARTTSEP